MTIHDAESPSDLCSACENTNLLTSGAIYHISISIRCNPCMLSNKKRNFLRDVFFLSINIAFGEIVAAIDLCACAAYIYMFVCCDTRQIFDERFYVKRERRNGVVSHRRT